MAEYALRDIQKPIGVSEYQMTSALPENFKVACPLLRILKAKWRKICRESKKMQLNIKNMLYNIKA